MKTIYFTILFATFVLSVNGQGKKLNPSLFNSIIKERPADLESLSAPDSLGKRTPLKMPNASSQKTNVQALPIIPYPIIFIHGLNSQCNTWDPYTNYLDQNFLFTYGGRFDFSLNADGNNYTTNQVFNTASTPNGDMYLFNGTWNNGDYFYVNFDVGNDGSVHPNGSAWDVMSNQSAIAKQGEAIAYVIYYVLQITGRDKVVLMGHSMGGLAAREYLQNWSQLDNQHHVAKLTTTGTPHGGSDEVTGGAAFTGVDCQSEAYRDLRTTYSGSGDPGIYLFGGVENNTVTDLTFCNNFYNIDVNCNGIINENVIGLNYKAIPLDLSYSCAIGRGSGLGGDGAVGEFQADLNNYESLTFPADTFILQRPSSGSATGLWHTDLPLLIKENVTLLDEANEYSLSYHVGFDTLYTAFTTKQPTNGYSYDYDDFKFSQTTSGNVTVTVDDIYLANLMVRFVDLAENTIGSVMQSNGSTSMTLTQNLSVGNYYLEILGVPTSTSYYFPYNFILNTTVTGIENIEKVDNISIYPNPASNTLNVKGITSTTTIKLFDILGKLVIEIETDCNKIIDTSQLTDGVYTFVAEKKNSRTFNKLVIAK